MNDYPVRYVFGQLGDRVDVGLGETGGENLYRLVWVLH